MADWTLVPCLVTLREEFNTLNPNRDKASDGSVGDTSHAANESDHNPDESGATHDEDSDSKNEVHAIDVDKTGPWPNGMTMWAACDFIRAEHKAGRDNRIQTIIHMDPDGNSKIATNDNGYVWKPYGGTNPHGKHAHFSAFYDTGARENDTSPYGLLEKWGDDMTEADFKKWMTNWANSADGKKAIGLAVLTCDPGDNTTGEANGGVVNPDYAPPTNTNATVGANYALNRAVVAAKVAYEVRDDVAEVLAAVQEIQTVNAQEVADLIIAALPEGALTQEQVEQAVRNVLLNGAAAPSA